MTGLVRFGVDEGAVERAAAPTPTPTSMAHNWGAASDWEIASSVFVRERSALVV